MGMIAGTVRKICSLYPIVTWYGIWLQFILVKQIFHIKYGFDEAAYQISKAICLLVSHKKILKVFPHTSLCKTSDPFCEAIFDPRVKMQTVLVTKGPLD